MADDITQNPDYRLVMAFLKNINPGDMDQESSEQLRMIGQRIQAGGALTDREREMFEAIVGAMPQMPTDLMRDTGAAMTDAEINQMLRKESGAAISDAERRAIMSEGEMMGTYQVDDGEMQMTPSQMKSMQESGAITPDTGRVMSLQEAIDAGFVTPTRPQARPTAPMQSMRPQTRR